MSPAPPLDTDTAGLFSGQRCVWVNGPVIVGAGPSGLAVAACLRSRGIPFVILERSDGLASLWQHRTYDRLKLHLPKRFCHLPILPFPSHFPEYPTRLQFLTYLHSYAELFDVHPLFNQRVVSARYDVSSQIWRVRSESGREGEVEYMCQWVVVATGENAEPAVPEIEGVGELGGEVVHTADYKSGERYRGKRVVVVGCGNSGMEVCLDLCHHGAFPSMVVRNPVHVLPREILGKSTFEIAMVLATWLPLWLVDKILLFLSWLILGNLERYGLRRPSTGPFELKNREGRTPVLDVGALAKIRSGKIEVVPGIRRFGPGKVELVDGHIRDADAVVLATGYRSNVPMWLQGTNFFGKNGYPKDPFPNGWKGKRGLYAVGFTKRGLSGASLDAVRVAEDISKEWREETAHANKLIT